MNELRIVHSLFKRNDSLTENDFHPCKPFFIDKEIQPESFDKIFTKGVFETTKYLRDTLKKVDYLLKVKGELIIEYYFIPNSMYGGTKSFLRPLSFFMYEFSISLKERYKLIDKKIIDNICFLKFVKASHALEKNDNINSWSFCIVSNGEKNDRILKTIDQIMSFNIKNYEILICGPTIENFISKRVKYIDDSDLYTDIRIPISRKKNRLIGNAKFNNLVIFHDRISFPSNWYERILEYGNCFEVLAIKIVDEKTRNKRIQDWLYLKGDFAEYTEQKNGALKYTEWSPHIYVDGGFLIAKKRVLQKTNYNNALNWGEAEDVDLSRRLYLDGININFYENCYVMSSTHRHSGIPLSGEKGLGEKIRGFLIFKLLVYIKRYVLNEFILTIKFKKFLSKTFLIY